MLILLGSPEAGVLGVVESLELPASAKRLDSLLRLRGPGGSPYVHLVEWRGYRDPALLWRLLSYREAAGDSTKR